MSAPLYPDIPTPQMIAAWSRLGKLDYSAVPMFAAHWLVQGFDGPALAEMAGLNKSQSREIADLLPAALSECGLTVPTTRLAAAIVIFADLAERYQTGRAGEIWIIQKVGEVLGLNNYDKEIMEQPLGNLWASVDFNQGSQAGLTSGELTDLVRSSCTEQLRLSMLPPVVDLSTTTLWRPTGPQELALVEASGWKEWPPRLADQPIFYPVLSRDYATQIARDWNVQHSGAGYVTRFDARTEFLRRYDVQQVGGRTILEYWIPATDLTTLNENIVGAIEVVESFPDSA